MDQRDQLHPDGDSPDSIAFRAAMRDDPSAPGTTDEGGPVAHATSQRRIELGYPFEDADVLADLFLNDLNAGPTVARIGPGGVVGPAGTSRRESYFNEPKTPAVSRENPTIRPATQPQPPDIELLLVGHLPVLGSAWVMQYSKHVAQQTGAPVGLIRLSGGEATVDLSLPPSEVPPQNGPMPSIAEAVRYVAQRTGRWIIRLDESADRASAADAASSIRLADRVTVLTGADEAAVVGCYRVIKTLEPGEGTPRLHVAVMGSNQARADEAAGKLSRAAEKFLSSKVTSEACSAKITPGSSVNVYRGRPNAGHAELIALVRGGPAPLEEARTTIGQPEWNAEVLEHELEEPRESPEAIARRFDEAHAPVAASVLSAAPVVPVAAARIESKPSPDLAVPGTETAARTQSEATGAKAFIESRGLARHLDRLDSLASRCPYAPEVELAIDPTGRLHLIARVAGDPGAALSALTTARAWAQAHASIMAMAHPRLQSAAAVCHLMTDAPKSVRRLGDGDVRLHLLTAPTGTPEDGPGWVCVELN